MAAGIAKLQLLIDLKNNLKAGLDTAKNQVKKSVGQIQDKLDSFKTSNINAFNAIKDEVPGVSRAIELLTNPYILATSAVIGLGLAIGGATMMANDWHTQMAKINVTAGMSQEELGKLSDKLLDIGGKNVAPLEEVPQAFNRIISAGLSVNDSLATLEPTLRAAKAGFTDIETVASAAVSVMQSSGEDANKVYDILFATVKEGNAEFKDIAQYLPKVIPLARNVGFALNETAGAYASLTTKLSAEQSTTALQGIMRSLSNKDIVKNFKGIGIQIFDNKTGKVKPILDIIKDLKTQMTGLSDQQKMLKFGKLGLDQESMLGFSTLMQDVPNLQKSINSTTNSQGALNKAYEDSKVPLDNLKETINNLKIYAIRFGEYFLPVLNAIGKIALWVLDNLDMIGGVLGGLAIAWAAVNIQLILMTAWTGILAVKTALVTAAQWAWNIAMGANPIGAVIMLLGALIGGMVVAYNKFDKFRAIVQGTWSVVKGFGTILKDFVIDRIQGLLSGLGSIADAIKKLFAGDFKGALTSTKTGIKELSGYDAAKKAFDKTKNLKQDFTIGYDNSMQESLKNKVKDKAKSTTSKSTETKSQTSTADANTIASGSQTKNVTINIDSFVKGFTPTHQSINKMNTDELERWMTEMFLRVVRSAELSA